MGSMESSETTDRVLIVEDSPSTRMIARATIEKLGLKVVEAPTGEEALARFESEDIGAVLLDVGLPDIDGFEVAERIRAHEKGADTPIIMLTGKDDIESIQRAFSAGATDFASKPVSWIILGHRLLFRTRVGAAPTRDRGATTGTRRNPAHGPDRALDLLHR